VILPRLSGRLEQGAVPGPAEESGPTAFQRIHREPAKIDARRGADGLRWLRRLQF